MAKSKKVVKRISIALLTGLGVIASVIGVKNIFNPNKPKVDKDLEKLVENLNNKILNDIKEKNTHYVSDEAKAYFSHVNNNSINPIIGSGKYTIDFYGVLVDHSGQFSFKTEYELPQEVKDRLENVDNDFYEMLNEEINNLVLTDIEMSQIMELDEEFKKPEFAKKFANYIGKTIDPSITETVSSAEFLPIFFEKPTIEKVYTRKPQIIPPTTIHDKPIIVDEGKFHYESKFTVVGIESHKDSNNNILNGYVRAQEFNVILDDSKEYTPEEIRELLFNEINSNSKQFSTENTYTSQKIENYNRMQDLMRHSFDYHNSEKPKSTESEINNEKSL